MAISEKTPKAYPVRITENALQNFDQITEIFYNFVANNVINY